MKISGLDMRRRELFARVLVALQFPLLGALTLLSIIHSQTKAHQYLIFEVILGVIGGLIILVAARNLKPALKISPIPKENAPLISVGIYRYVRHPMYLAVILIGFSLAGYAGSPFAWAIEILLVLTLNIKASFEDALILDAHPEALQYQMHTSRLIPCMGNTCRSNCETR
jgi:protein-S-isoprenylcysteine O-methyltransferase Ste14